MTTLRWGAATHPGRVRARNEDSLLADLPVFVVADGMGGHAAGDLASRLAVEQLAVLVGRRDVRAAEVEPLLVAANEAILDAGRDAASHGLGTTLVALVVVEDPDAPLDPAGGWRAIACNIGDSRLYRLAGGELAQLTVDHSYVQELVDAGFLGPDEAARHPDRNVVTRALGSPFATTADYWPLTLALGERYLLCSDGLTNEVAAGPLAEILGAAAGPQIAADALVEAAVEAGGRDNVTVVVVDVVPAPEPETEPEPGTEDGDG